MTKYPFIPLPEYQEYSPAEMLMKARDFYEHMKRRRTVRQFSDRPVAKEVIEQCLLAAGTAPNGANMQPWKFVVVSDPKIKKQIRAEAEKVEHEFYNGRAPEYWLEALAPLGTDENKTYLEEAPYLIVIFTDRYTVKPGGNKIKNFYLSESVGIATGMLITALHTAGLVTLTHTPTPMAFLRQVLGRPTDEVPFMVLVAGYPKADATVPVITKKSLDEIAVFM
jgi:nitroreductase